MGEPNSYKNINMLGANVDYPINSLQQTNFTIIFHIIYG